MKVIYFTKYTRKGASSRLRSYQYFPFLEKENIDISLSPLFNDKYLDRLYSKKSISIFHVISQYIKRLFTLLTVNRFDLIIIEKELFPYCSSWTEYLLKFMGYKYVVDYDDAIFHNYDQHPNKVIKYLLANKIDKVMKNSSLVIAGNNYLAERAKSSGAKDIEIIPTVIDLDRYAIKQHSNSPIIKIGWIGSLSTFKYIKSIIPFINLVALKYPIELHLVGISKNELHDLPSYCKAIYWTEETEVASILNFDIGIMPLSNTKWELGKCSYKLIQYMACGLPVVASAVGMNKEVIKDTYNGFLIHDDVEWETKLTELITNMELRASLGEKGRKIVEQDFCIQQTNNLYISSLKKV